MAAKAFSFLELRHIQVVESSSAQPIHAPTSSNSSQLKRRLPHISRMRGFNGDPESEPGRFGVVASSACPSHRRSGH